MTSEEFDDLDEALAQSPEIMFVTNPNSKHMQVALAGARAGCHLFIEKPMSDSLDGIQDLARPGCGGRGGRTRRLPVPLPSRDRGAPEDRAEQTMGEVLAAHVVNGEFLPDWHPYEDYRQTHPAIRALGGGSLRIQSHELDYACWIFGPPRRLFAVGGQLTSLEVGSGGLRHRPDGNRIDASSRSVDVHLDYAQRPPRRACEVLFDRGRATWDYYANRLDVVPREGERSTRSYEGFARNEMFVIELRHFLECVRGNERPLVDLREAEASLRVALAAERSLRTRRAEELSDVA